MKRHNTRSIADRLFVLNELTPRRGYKNSPERVFKILSKLAIEQPTETTWGFPQRPVKRFVMKDGSAAIMYETGYIVEDKSYHEALGSQTA